MYVDTLILEWATHQKSAKIHDQVSIVLGWLCSTKNITIRVNVRVMGYNVPFNNISVVSWPTFVLVEDTRVYRENHRPATSH